MITGKTSTGFEYEVNEKIVNDWRFVKAVATSAAKDDTAKIAGYMNLVSLLLGDDGEDRLCEHCRQDDGIVPTERIGREVLEIMTAIGEQQKK